MKARRTFLISKCEGTIRSLAALRVFHPVNITTLKKPRLTEHASQALGNFAGINLVLNLPGG